MTTTKRDWIAEALKRDWIEYLLIGRVDGKNVYRLVFTDETCGYYHIDEEKEEIEEVEILFHLWDTN